VKRITSLCLIAATVAAGAAQTAAAADAAAGKEKASKCMTCHGVNGISTTPLVPNLAGQKEAYIVKALKDYRDGKRDNSIMRSMASSLSDADIADLAAFFSSLSPK
jgi:cytochrome c553